MPIRKLKSSQSYSSLLFNLSYPWLEKQGRIWASKGATLFRCGQGGGDAVGGGRIDGPLWIWILGRLANSMERGFAPEPHSRDRVP
jgi:hypothetical protein